MTNNHTISEDEIAVAIKNHPSFNERLDEALEKILDELIPLFPESIAQSAVAAQSEVMAVARQRLKEKLDEVDPQKLGQAVAQAILKNGRPGALLKLELEQDCLLTKTLIMDAVREQISSETALIRNLLEAGNAQRRAQKRTAQIEMDEMNAKRRHAWMKVQLEWMKVTQLSVATPLVMLGALVGAIAFANYVPAIACYKGDAICHLRVRPGVFPAK
jgi:hypothetical protein